MENTGTKQPQVDYTLKKLENGIDSLQKNIDGLRNNLAQILTMPESKDCVDENESGEHYCELAHKINNFFRRIDYMNDQITIVVNGLEISPSIIPEISEDVQYKTK